MSAVTTGLDRLAADQGRLVTGRTVALLSHPASVDRRLRPARAVLEAAGAKVTVLLGPEHGLDGEAQDMEGVAAKGRRGPRVYSLYGDSEASLRPTAEMLDGVELVVVDLQDVGSRYYTFVWTAALCLEACAEQGLGLLALDRPNPLGGVEIEGPGIEPGYHSFVGHHDVVTRHGATLGELLRLYARERGLADHLEVVPMEGWRRSMWFDETGLPWVLPSPNMPATATATVYPGACLIEATTASEGRGTTRPFEIVGAPWVEGEALARALEAERLEGCRFRPLRFKPMFQKHAGERCGGVQLHVTDRDRFRPLRAGVALVQALRAVGGERFGWRTEPYEFVVDRPAIDLLAGGRWLREGVEAGAGLEELCRGWSEAERAYRERLAEVELYKNQESHSLRRSI